ncbi:MAG: bifunctional nicotinamidase/pyrazinamidase [Candidatus Methanomethylicota archaeon]|nr:MAG: bifunctional nicotinamidase/pyrazinamidase [Candidatus Verstraetearchaeota archaeon]
MGILGWFDALNLGIELKIKVGRKDALIIVDVQKDFCPGGALPVPEGDKIIPNLNKYVEIFRKNGGKIYATRDWHPENHISFKEYGGLWPKHCVQGTEGAEFHPNLKLPEDAVIISKGTDPLREAYSGFEGTDLKKKLKQEGIVRVFVGGLATEYCVKNTVLDAIKFGFETVLLMDAIKGIDLKPSDSRKAIDEMVKRGVKTVKLENFEIEN